MAPRGYLPVSAHPSPSLASSRLFDVSPAPEPPLRILLHYVLRPKGALALFVLGVLIVMMQIPLPSPTARWGLVGEIDLDATWDQLFNASRAGWRPYEPIKKLAKGQEMEMKLTSGETWSDSCLEEWMGRGKLCASLKGLREQEKVDLLYTWTNGSDPLLSSWRIELTRSQASLNGRVRPELVKIKEITTRKHFREHDELRFSLRSAIASFLPNSINKIRLLTADLPVGTLLHDIVARNTPSQSSTAGASAPLPLVSTSRVGQVPTWLSSTNLTNAEPPLEVVHHYSIFDDVGNTPTFSSRAIESQIPNLENCSEFQFYLNDDCFLLGPLTAADVGSPLYGPVFRLQRDFVVNGVSPSDKAGDAEGEWPGLRHANWLLDRRFGTRNRGYLAHISKATSTPLLAEMHQLWNKEFSQTAASRFRGRKAEEFGTLFLATHYIIESHRQALLYSYFFLRADTNLDGSLSLAERHQLLDDLGLSNSELEASEAPYPLRSTLQDLPQAFEATGLESPRSTEIVFDSRDGFAMFTPAPEYREGPPPRSVRVWPTQWPIAAATEEEGEERAPKPVCSFSRSQCLGAEFLRPSARVSTNDLLRRVAFEHPECGDCAILLLMGKSGKRGLEAFLPVVDSGVPSSSTTTASSSTPFTPLGPPSTTYDTLDFSRSPSSSIHHLTPLDARRRALRLIQRYRYAIGDSPSRFVAMKMPHLVNKALATLDEEKNKGERPAFLTLNDDLTSDRAATTVDDKLASWFAKEWPNPSPYEREG
ncbi:hypothetical protein BCR35DRAFT_269821 [Leucosporidium creatinivorum]|uniref:Stealth protein CR3 conserved region 3 domain-containing protein n=1 Tax=Leucosporidium creatinivorum TaxID=106004 RepID=A0A1Y2EEP7_9BASI|nr:hypothetical protein BCR35DRAFT_269821 [Leucosporidium creatinivorum]